MLLELVIFFALASAAATLAALIPGAPRAPFWLGLPLGASSIAVAAWSTAVAEGDRAAGTALGVVALFAWLAGWWWLRRWGAVAALLFTVMLVAAAAYLVYAAVQTSAQLSGAAVLVGSVLLFVLEVGALSLSLSYVFEILDVVGQRRDRRRPLPQVDELPWVALQVPTYSEPIEVVRPTLESLAGIDYPRLLVQVVDNNTRDPAIWQPLEELCRRLGPRFSFLHLDPWPGYKAGALNEATRRLPREIEVIGVVDADYVVDPRFLSRTVPFFADPAVAFVQSAQHYRDWEDDPYLRGLFYSYRYFFDVSLPARAHRNAIIFCGTMGLIRRSALEEIGGWDETCITEDAEASLRMLGSGRNHLGVYDPRPWGAGLMPLSFDGLKKQRFRWALGGIQILRQHWRELVPFAHHRLRLRPAQRVHYLLGSVQWFGDLLTACFTVLLLLTAVAIGLHHRLPVRQLTGAVLVIPLVFLGTGLLRAMWAMRVTTGCSWGDAVRALRVWFALSWVVTLACLRGLVRSQAEFLRTAKRKEGESSLWHALRSSRTETALSACAVLAAIVMIVRAPSFATGVLAVLLLFQAWLYASAPWASVAAEGISLTPLRRSYLASPQSSGDRPAGRRALVTASLVGIAGAGAAAVAAALILTSPPSSAPFSAGRDAPRIGNISHPAPPASVPESSPSPSPSASASPVPSPSPRPSPRPTTTPQPSANPASPSPAR
ncbi:MAG: glycosyltransferase [Chloroflexi bacterium]|nr:MAG: glycosyltransferase [Chloroflexota bacterium]